MKRIVTHHSPDLDAVTSVWLIHRFLPGWKDAQVEYVSQGKTLNDKAPDRDSSIMHVDTGLGKFDHHQSSDYTCAARLVLTHLIEQEHVKDSEADALSRMVDVVTRFDHFKEALIPEADDDLHAFTLSNIISALKINGPYTEVKLDFVELALDGVLQYMKGKVHAEELIKTGHILRTYWGKTLVIETDSDMAMKVAFMQGFDMVIRYSPNYKNVAFKIHPKSKKPLKKLEQAIVPNDPGAWWFYHASGKMLLNASTKDTKSQVTRFSLQELLEMVKSI